MTKILSYALPLALFAGYCYADTVTICTETSADGCSGPIATADPTIIVGSDGESGFDPLGLGFDQSDYILFSAGSPWTISASTIGWVRFDRSDGSFGWALPADLTSIGCGTENEPTCEPLGTWAFLPGAGWNTGTPENQVILDEDGSIGDFIHVFNDANGTATITFQSDPFPAVPEPGSVVLLMSAIAAVGLKLGKKRLAGKA